MTADDAERFRNEAIMWWATTKLETPMTVQRAVLLPEQYPYSESRERFENVTAGHEMTILRNDGLYRHVRFRSPNFIAYYYDLITWPGHLVICGDNGTYHFARTSDMFGFFGSDGDINPHYWSEKLQGPGYDTARRFSERAYRARVLEWAHQTHLREWERVFTTFQVPGDTGLFGESGLLAAVRDELLRNSDELFTVDQALDRLIQFNYHEIRIEEPWLWDLKEYDSQFLWCCWAIVRGIRQYRKRNLE